MENNKNNDVTEFISSIINSIIEKVFKSIDDFDNSNPEKADADIKFNTLNLDEIISQVNNSINIFSSFDNVLLSNSILNSEENETKKEPIKINTIEELLLNEEQITEIIYTYDKRYKDCFNENNMLKLIDYSTHMAYISDDDIMTHKYPFYACELLRCDAPYIYEKFFENEKIMSYFFEFLNDEKNRSNNVLSGYFTKIFLSLLDKKNDDIINYIFKEENLYIEEIIELCEDSSFCDCVKNLLILQSDKHDEKKLFILKRLNMKLFRNEEYTNKICFEIYSSLLEEGNLVFCNFFLRNFEKIFENYDYGYKNKKINFELFGYYIHLVRVIKECFTREKENNVDLDITQMTRKSLNTYVINNRQIFLDFELNLLDSTTSILFIRNSTEDNIEKITYRRILVAYLDILVYIIFTASIKYDIKSNNNDKKDYKYYINKIHDIFTANILLKITNVIFSYPLFNMLQVSYINLILTLSEIKSPLINNDIIINNCIDYIIHENTEKDILISFLVKVLYIIYQSLKDQNILLNKKLKYAYEAFIKNINDIFETKLLFNHPYGSEKKQNEKKIDEIDEINNTNNETNINNKISIKNIDNNESYSNNNYTFKDVVNKGIYDYINRVRFCNSSKNLTSVDNISEEIDLDDFNDDDIDENNNNNKNHKQFTLTTFDEIDDEDSNNNDSIGEIFKQTADLIKSIKLRNKINEENKNKEFFNKNILNNIVINPSKDKDKEKQTDNNIDDINNNINQKNKKSKTMNKFKSKSKPNFSVNVDHINSLPLIINNNYNSHNNNINNNENENFNSKKIVINSLKESNKDALDKININNFNNNKMNKIFENNIKNKDNNINIKILKKIKKNLDENNHGRYFYYDMNNKNKKNIVKNNSNLNDKINNFRSNNIIKIKEKEKKENSIFNLKKSSDNSSNFKYCLTLINKDNNKDKNQIQSEKRLNEI